MITLFILYVKHYSHFVEGGVDVLISEENGDVHENHVETAICHRVLEADGCEVLNPIIQHNNAPPKHKSPKTTGVAVPAFQRRTRPRQNTRPMRSLTKEHFKGPHFNCDDVLKAAILSW